MSEQISGMAIFSRARKQEIADGRQIKLDGEFAEIAGQVGLKYPVYLTVGVSHLIGQAVESKQFASVNDVLRYFLWSAYLSVDPEFLQPCNVTFSRQKHTLYLQVSATDSDDPTPALTIMLANET